MKKRIIFSICILFSLHIQAQTDLNGSGGTNSGSGWWRGGNTQGNGANIMATTWNSPIYWYTDGYAGGNTYQGNRLRMKLNGTFVGVGQYAINGYGSVQGINTSGYLGLGYTSNGLNGNLWAQQGPFSLLTSMTETAPLYRNWVTVRGCRRESPLRITRICRTWECAA